MFSIKQSGYLFILRCFSTWRKKLESLFSNCAGSFWHSDVFALRLTLSPKECAYPPVAGLEANVVWKYQLSGFLFHHFPPKQGCGFHAW